MGRSNDKKVRRQRIRFRYRGAVRGTGERPRLAVFRSLRHVYAQLIDDEKGVTLASASTLEKSLSGGLKSTGGAEAASAIGKAIAERGKEHGVEKVVFDRGGFPFHGVIKSLAEAARGAGLKF